MKKGSPLPLYPHSTQKLSKMGDFCFAFLKNHAKFTKNSVNYHRKLLTKEIPSYIIK